MARRHFTMFTKLKERTNRQPEVAQDREPEIIAHDVPLMIDDVKNFENFSMTRCSYFSIESDLPSLDWFLELEKETIPFYLLGLSGVIVKPVGDNLTFDSPALIDELFDQIEDHPSLFVDTNDIWLLNFLFNGPHKRGCVYRIGVKLFNEAYRYKENQISESRFLSLCEELMQDIRYSEDETDAFRRWENGLVNKAIDLYPKNSALALEWFE